MQSQPGPVSHASHSVAGSSGSASSSGSNAAAAAAAACAAVAVQVLRAGLAATAGGGGGEDGGGLCAADSPKSDVATGCGVGKAAVASRMGCSLVVLKRRPASATTVVGAATGVAAIGAIGAGVGTACSRPSVGGPSDGDGRGAACGDALPRCTTAQLVLENHEAHMSPMQARNLSLEHEAAKRGKAEHRRAYSRSRALRSLLLLGSRQRREQKSQLPAVL